MITLDVSINEKSTKCFFVTLKDSANVIIPTSLKWTLVDPLWAIVNLREQIVVPVGELGAGLDEEGQASTVIVLSGDDLALTALEEASRRVERDGAFRYLVIEATYDGDCGNDLPFNEAIKFTVENLPYITG